MNLNNNSRKSVLSIAGIILLAGVAAAIMSVNFKLGNYLLPSSGGGKMSSATKSSSVSFGQNLAGKTESANFKSGAGYISNITATTRARAADNLEKAYVYPNPFKPGSGGDYDAENITFSNLTEQTKIEIYNIAGELVATIDKNNDQNEKQWNAANDAGKKLASGVYIFYISNDNGQKKTGKFAIVK